MPETMKVSPLGDERTHYLLAMGMAKAAGVDLVAAVEAGSLDQDEWSALVQRCRGCGWERTDGACGRWLAGQEPGTATVPSTCVNQSEFEDLQARAG